MENQESLIRSDRILQDVMLFPSISTFISENNDTFDPGFNYNYEISWILRNTQINNSNQPRMSSFKEIYEAYVADYKLEILTFYSLENPTNTTQQVVFESHVEMLNRLDGQDPINYLSDEIIKRRAKCLTDRSLQNLLEKIYFGLKRIYLGAFIYYNILFTRGIIGNNNVIY